MLSAETTGTENPALSPSSEPPDEEEEDLMSDAWVAAAWRKAQDFVAEGGTIVVGYGDK